MIHLVKFPINNAWGYLLGQTVHKAIHISMNSHYLFPSRAEAVDAANVIGLSIDDSGKVTANSDN